jgi:DivIVA domain-containing protein
MTDSSSTPMFPARDARLTPEGVAERAFTQVKRGYAESEVRAFLRMVSDDLTTMRSRERELANRVRDLEERLQQPAQAPSDQDLIAALGAETARVLTQARDAAADLRNKADEHARRVVREAQESARELRNSTQAAVESKTREAEEAARARAREILGEARALRDRVIADMTERRAELERQIGELRTNRGKLVEVYEMVERTLMQATRAIADEPPMPPAGPTPPAPPESAERASDDAPPDVAPPTVTDDRLTGAGESAPPTDSSQREDAQPTAHDTESADDGRDVGALFQKLRSSGGAPADAAAPPIAEAGSVPAAEAPGPVEPAEPAAPITASAGGDDDTTVLPADDVSVDATEVEEPVGDEAGGDDQAALTERDTTLAPIADDLAHRAKRAVQDEQNDVLDGLRRQRGKIDVGKVLPPAEEQLTRWAHVLQPSVDLAYAAGAATMPSDSGSDSGSGAAAAVPGALLTELATIVVTPLRTRLDSSLESIDAKSPADVEIAIAQRLGARYREWRGQDLEEVLGDALAAAYARGAYDAAPEGSQLRWVAARVGKCPDCDDNALEPTARGEDFPTGQAHPPAHPGCRCLVVLA